MRSRSAALGARVDTRLDGGRPRRFCVEHGFPGWFRKAITERVCKGELEGDLAARVPPCGRLRAILYSSRLQCLEDPDKEYPGELTIMEDEEPASAVELYLSRVEKEIRTNRSAWDKQQDAWEKNRTTNAALAGDLAGVARRKDARDRALREIDELDWLLANHTLSEPMRVPGGHFRNALLAHVCGLPSISCEGRKRPLPELPITLDGGGGKQGRKRVIQRRSDVGVLEATPERHASTLWIRPER